jgi:hypothetical protein
MSKFITCTPLYQILLGKNSVKFMWAGHVTVVVRNEKFVRSFGQKKNMKGRNHLEDLDVDGPVISKPMLRRIRLNSSGSCIRENESRG